jgi:hypothetical protein
LKSLLKKYRKKYYSKFNKFWGNQKMEFSTGFRTETGVSKYYGAQEGNDFLLSKLCSDVPFLAVRYGNYELKAVASFILNNPDLLKKTFPALCLNAGFFPKEIELAEKFFQEYKKVSTEIDVFGAMHFRHGLWREEEKVYSELCPNSYLTDIHAFNFYNFNNPWTKGLEGKKVLVIHPFSISILEQYNSVREKLHKNPDTLPRFKSLETIKAIQSSADNHVEFNNWFDALNHMKNQILEKEFDVALIGAGAYGIPLAGFVKSLGKQGIHLGGTTQLIFGIKGKRWDNNKHFSYNEFWTRPKEDEKPLNFSKVEGGCYW